MKKSLHIRNLSVLTHPRDPRQQWLRSEEGKEKVGGVNDRWSQSIAFFLRLIKLVGGHAWSSCRCHKILLFVYFYNLKCQPLGRCHPPSFDSTCHVATPRGIKHGPCRHCHLDREKWDETGGKLQRAPPRQLPYIRKSFAITSNFFKFARQFTSSVVLQKLRISWNVFFFHFLTLGQIRSDQVPRWIHKFSI